MPPRTRILLFTPLLALLALARLFPHALTPADPPPDYSLIEPGLYLGSRTPAPPPHTFATLNLCQNPDLYTTPIYQWSPIPDAAPAPSLDWLKSQVDFITAQSAANHPLYIHCNAGRSRSVLVTAAYLMQSRHLSKANALALIKQKCPVAHPIQPFLALLDQWQSLTTPPPTAPTPHPPPPPDHQ